MVAVRSELEEHAARSVYDGRARLQVIEASAPAPAIVRADALPEHATYRDTGCDLSASCLKCPFDRCKYDERGGSQRMRMQARDREISHIRERHGAPIDMLAMTYGVSRRTVFRILKEQRA